MMHSFVRGGLIGVHFPAPNDEHRREIFATLREGYSISDSVSSEDINKVLSKTEGWTGAQLQALLNEAGILCVADEREEIHLTDLLKAYERITLQKDGGE